MGMAKPPFFEQPCFNLHFQGSGRRLGPVVYSAVQALNGHELLYLCFMGAIWAAARLSNSPGVIPAVMVAWELGREPAGRFFSVGFWVVSPNLILACLGELAMRQD
uniref:Uncharacterized protein n=1 Tax=Serinus canaria TaxID=9135 RepID=A0A8C9MFA5_SERCA